MSLKALGMLLMVGLFAVMVGAAAQEAAPPSEEAAPVAEGEAAAAAEPAAAEPVAAEPAAAEPAPVEGSAAIEQPRQLTLWDMIWEGGGPILWVIVALSMATVVMAIYCFLTITPAREVPPNFMRRALVQIDAGDLRGAYQMCEGRDELLARVLRAGLKMHGHDRYVIQDAMESEGERGANALWQRISYLNNVGVLAPLLGLLGTVVGMIQAFGAIALDDSQVKAINMAYGVSKAMVTTAAGLVLAIPAMLVYFYMRGRVVKIIAEVEAQSSELIEALTRSHTQ